MKAKSISQIVIKNTTAQMFSQGLSLIIGLLTTFILSRHLGVENFGRFHYVFAFYYFLLIVNNFGIDTIATREISRAKDRAAHVIGAMLTLKVLIAFLGTLMVWGIVLSIGYDSPLQNALLVYSAILTLSALKLPAIIFQVVLKMEYPSVIAIIHRLMNFAAILMVVISGQGIIALSGAVILAEVVNVFILLTMSRRFVKPKLQIDVGLWREILHSSVPVAITGIFIAIINRADFIMIEKMTDVTQLGYYSAAYRVINLVESFPLMVMASIYPLLSQYSTKERDKLRSLYRNCFFFFTLIAIPMGLGGMLFSKQIISFLFGVNFQPAVQALQILIWASVFLYLAITGGNVLVSIGKERWNMFIQLIAATMNVMLNFLWIPKMGFVGAAWATTVAFGLIFILTAVSVNINLKKQSLSCK